MFEHGYVLAKLERKSVAAFVKGDIETPSDIDGVVYIPINYDSWKHSLVKELKSAGYEIDANK